MGISDILGSGLFWAIIGGGALVAWLLFLYMSKVEAHNYKLEKLPAITCGGEQNGAVETGNGQRKLTILHLSDLHLAEPESAKLEFLEKISEQVYDLIVITGDIFENESGLQYAKYLGIPKARLGTYAVLGNHDYYAYTWFNKTVGRINRKHRHPQTKRDVEPFIKALEDSGVRTMRNTALHIQSDDVYLIGIDYPGISAEELKELSQASPQGALTLAILHLPRRLQQLVNNGIDLAFAGHTHGGQVRLPMYGALFTDSELPRHEASGLVKRGDTLIHVSRGLGADPKTNFRLLCPPAASILEVHY